MEDPKHSKSKHRMLRLLAGLGLLVGCQAPGSPASPPSPRSTSIDASPLIFDVTDRRPPPANDLRGVQDLVRATALLEARIPRTRENPRLEIRLLPPGARGDEASPHPDELVLVDLEPDLHPALAYLRQRRQTIEAVRELTELWYAPDARTLGPDPVGIGTWIAMETLGPDRGLVPTLANALALDTIRRRVNQDDATGALRVHEWSRGDTDLGSTLQPLFLAYLYRHVNRDDQRFRQALADLDGPPEDASPRLIRQLARMDDRKIDAWIDRLSGGDPLPVVDYSSCGTGLIFVGDSHWLVDPQAAQLLVNLGSPSRPATTPLAGHGRISLRSPSLAFDVRVEEFPGGSVELTLVPRPALDPAGPVVLERVEGRLRLTRGGVVEYLGEDQGPRPRLINLTTATPAGWPADAVLMLKLEAAEDDGPDVKGSSSGVTGG